VELREAGFGLGGSDVRRPLLRLGSCAATADAGCTRVAALGGNDADVRVDLLLVRAASGTLVVTRRLGGGLRRCGPGLRAVVRVRPGLVALGLVGIALRVQCVVGMARVACVVGRVLIVPGVLAERVGGCGLRAQRDPRQLALCCEARRPLRLALELALGSGTLAPAALLHDVRELVRDDEFAAPALEIDAALEVDLLRARKRLLARGHLGAVDVDLDVAEVMAEHPLHAIAHRHRQPHRTLLGGAESDMRGERRRLHPRGRLRRPGRLHRRQRLGHLAGTGQRGAIGWRAGVVTRCRGLAIGLLPPLRLGDNPGGAARGARRHLVDAPALERATIELDAYAREPADIRREPAAACCDARRDLVEPPLGLLGVEPAGGVGGISTHSVPDRERQLGRQAIASPFDDGIERVSRALALKLVRMHPARHRRIVSLRASR